MKVSAKWLQRHLSANVSVDDLLATFTNIGLEVEDVATIGLARQDSLVVGEIQKIEKHPNADKLSVCSVRVGGNDVRQIVCGAKNFKLMDHVPVALPGTKLPGGIDIQRSNLRGVSSDGMMCSGRELGIGNDHSGLLILESDTKVGSCLHDAINIQNDTVFDISVTANRGDCLSYTGIARDVAAKLCIGLALPKIREQKENSENRPDGHFLKKISVSTGNCQLYSAICMKGVKVGESPEWIKRDLSASGIRSINNIVDIGNWVMLETGQPVHIFDARKIHGGELNIRQAKDGEKIVTLDGKERVLDSTMAVICDSERPLVIAGICGSVAAEIDDTTVDIVIESAHFDPDNVRRTSKALNLTTDSSYRFSRGINNDKIVDSGWLVADTIQKECTCQSISGCWVVSGKENGHTRISFQTKNIEKLCGFPIPLKFCKDALCRLGFNVLEKTADEWEVTVPAHRHDISRQPDVVTECLRMYGTENVATRDVVGVGQHASNDTSFNFTRNASKYFSDHGFLECYNLSLCDHRECDEYCGDSETVRPWNPLTSDQDSFRNSLIFGLLDTLKYNIQNGNLEKKFFEIGHVVKKINDKFYECLSVACAVTNCQLQRSWNGSDEVTFFDMESIIIPLLRNFSQKVKPFSDVDAGNKVWQHGHAGVCGQLNRERFQATCGTVNLELLKKFDIKGTVVAAEVVLSPNIFEKKQEKVFFDEYSNFPRISRDLSLIVDDSEKYSNIEQLANKALKKTTPKGVYIESINVFDVYRGNGVADGKKNIGITINYRSDDRTLSDTEVQNYFELLQNEISQAYEIRRL